MLIPLTFLVLIICFFILFNFLFGFYPCFIIKIYYCFKDYVIKTASSGSGSSSSSSSFFRFSSSSGSCSGPGGNSPNSNNSSTIFTYDGNRGLRPLGVSQTQDFYAS